MPNKTGSLKQQVLDPVSGLYDWSTKFIEINDENGCITIRNSLNDTKATNLSLLTAKYAKEWSVSSTIAGCGYDIVWSNGKIWSFLADSDANCQSWVKHINQTISNGANRSSINENDSATDSQIYSYQPNNDNAELSNTRTYDYNATLDANNRTPEMSKLKNIQPEPLPMPPVATHSTSYYHDISDIPVLRSSASSSPSQEPETSDNYSNAENIKSNNNDNNSVASNSIGGVAGVASGSAVGAKNKKEYSKLLANYEELKSDYDKINTTLQLAREQLVRIQTELDSRTVSYEKQIQAAWDADKQAIKEIRDECQRKIFESAKESASLNDASLKAIQQQHQQDMDCLREELSNERRRYTELIKKEIDSRDRSESKEVLLRYDINSVQEQLNRVTAELTRVKEVAKNDELTWEREKKNLLTMFQLQITKLNDEKEALLLRSAVDMKNKVEEMTQKFQSSMQVMENSISDTMRKQFEGDKLREIAVMQKKCQKDIETIRTDERKQTLQEVEKVKQIYIDRERQTTEDLNQLEKLHMNRVKKLEAMLDNSNNNLATCNAKITELEGVIAKKDRAIKSTNLEHLKQIDRHVVHAEELAAQLKSVSQALHESKQMEASYRDQLSKVIEDARIQRAECIEAKRIASDLHAKAYQWRTMAQDNDVHASANNTSLHIAHDEIRMLEMEVKRLKTEVMRYKQGNIHDNQSKLVDSAHNTTRATVRSMSPGRHRTGYTAIDYDTYSGHKIVKKKIIASNIAANSQRPTSSTKFIAL